MSHDPQRIVAIAEVAHEANRAYCRGIGDESQPSWLMAEQWQKDSAVHGVIFHLANPLAGDAASHQAWYDEKLRAGWRYGEVKDPVNKEHPCMVPFEDLPVEQQKKDALFRAIVHALA